MFLDTLAVPDPVRVPVPLMITAATGESVTLLAMVRLPEALKLSLRVVPEVLLKFRMLKAVV